MLVDDRLLFARCRPARVAVGSAGGIAQSAHASLLMGREGREWLGREAVQSARKRRSSGIVCDGGGGSLRALAAVARHTATHSGRLGHRRSGIWRDWRHGRQRIMLLLVSTTDGAVARELVVLSRGGWGGLGFCSRHGGTESCAAAREKEAL